MKSNDVWQEKARLENEIHKNKIESNGVPDNISVASFQSIELKDKSKTVNARRELFKESMKPLQRIQEVALLEVTRTSTKEDGTLVQWLEDIGVSRSTIQILLDEELNLRDVLEIMSRDDLNMIGLKKGPELRIWQKVERYRRESQKRSHCMNC